MEDRRSRLIGQDQRPDPLTAEQLPVRPGQRTAHRMTHPRDVGQVQGQDQVAEIRGQPGDPVTAARPAGQPVAAVVHRHDVMGLRELGNLVPPRSRCL
jgi:hypothetical protein